MHQIDLSCVNSILFLLATAQECGPEPRRRIRPLVTGVGLIEAPIGTALRLRDFAYSGCRPDLVVSLGSARSRCRKVGTV